MPRGKNMAKRKWLWMCESCWDLKDAVEIGPFPGGSLILQNGKYKILAGQGHGDDDILTFAVKPTPEPEDTDEVSDVWWNWHIDVNKTNWNNWNIDDADRIIKASKRFGYNSDKQYLSRWLYNKAGELIAEFEKKEFPKKSKHIDIFKAEWERYTKTKEDYNKLLSAASKARDVNPILVAKWMKKIKE